MKSKMYLIESANYLAFRLALLFLCLLIVVSCRPKSSDSTSTGNKPTVTENDASRYLQSLLKVGETPEDLTKRFGSPKVRYETETKELCLGFYFTDQNQPGAARAAGVGGFSGFFVSNRLTSWFPIYESRNPAFGSQAAGHAPVNFDSGQTALAFNVVQPSQMDGFIHIDAPQLDIFVAPRILLFSLGSISTMAQVVMKCTLSNLYCCRTTLANLKT
jgi:hypothetical protein